MTRPSRPLLAALLAAALGARPAGAVPDVPATAPPPSSEPARPQPTPPPPGAGPALPQPTPPPPDAGPALPQPIPPAPTATSTAAATPTAPAGPTYTLQLHDPNRFLQGPPQVSFGNRPGAPVRPRDDGTVADVHAGDRVFGGLIDGWDGATTQITVTDGTQTWKGRGGLEGGGQLWVRIRGRNKLEIAGDAISAAAPDMDPDLAPGGSGGAAPPMVAAAAVSNALYAWTAVGVALALGGGFAMVRGVRRRRPVAAPLTALTAVPTTRWTATHVRPDGVGEALSALGPRRVVVVGPAPAPLPAGCFPLAAEPGALPDEVVAAVEALAATDGPPVALLVTDARALDAPPRAAPLDRLAARVDGRFPLVVVTTPSA